MEQSTAQHILDIAQGIVRSRGYSAFSYADIAEQVGIRKASIHYHFPSKDDLVKTLVVQYREAMARKCDRIAQSNASLDQQLMQFADLYRDGLEQHQICLCAMLSADFSVLSDAIQAEIRAFFQQVEAWLADVLQRGCDTGVWHCYPSARQEAIAILALLQGAQLLARSVSSNSAVFEQAVYPFLSARLTDR